MRLLLALLTAGCLPAQTAPTFTADRVLPSGGSRRTPLAPGMLISIYGAGLGPAQACTGQADTRQTETPSLLRPRQSFVERLVYPKGLCGVQVFLAGRLAGLLYVHEKQINFKAPQETPVEGMAELRVVYNGRSSAPVQVKLGLETAALSVEEPARANGPVWVRVEFSHGWPGMVRYPAGIHPADFGCDEFEVRREGVPLPRIGLPAAGGVRSGPPCGHIGIPGQVEPLPRLPLHLQYRFDKPGVYEVRYTRRQNAFAPFQGEPLLRSPWSRFEVLPPAPVRIGPPPKDAGEALSRFLPDVLGYPDDQRLAAVLPFLYHPSDIVRRYTSLGLLYWPQERILRKVADLLKTKGPSDVVVDMVILRRPDLMSVLLPYLRSSDPVLVRGAVIGVYRLLSNRTGLSGAARTGVEDALLGAAEHVAKIGDPQTVSDMVAALGGVRGARGRALLWEFVNRGVARGQAILAISWRKDARDLPRLAALLQAPAERLDTELSSLPYALRNAYGQDALPYLENALRTSPAVWVRTNCARELILAGRPAGFAFVADAAETNQFYKRELIEFVRGQFPELYGKPESAVLELVRKRAVQ